MNAPLNVGKAFMTCPLTSHFTSHTANARPVCVVCLGHVVLSSEGA